ncbi:p48 [Kluyvera cryocrescens]|uniref:p48 n=1 Tax=Kluyvera cryocrescens TaxID=580 RepID=A0A485B589_KLUCR|nr:p48 [Kluyvera cryocrescens]
MCCRLSKISKVRLTAHRAEKLATKLKKGDGFDLTDFLEQLRQMKNMGGMASLMGKLPGMARSLTTSNHRWTIKCWCVWRRLSTP